MKKVVLIFFLIVACKKQQQETSKNVDLKKFDTGLLESTIDSLLNIGSGYLNKSESADSAFYYFEKSLKLSQSSNNKYLENKSLHYLAKLAFKENDYPKGIENYTRVINYFNKTNDQWSEANTLMELGNALFLKENKIKSYEEINEIFNKSLSIYSKLDSKKNQADVLNHMAHCYLNDGKLILANNKLLEALALYKSVNYRNLHHTYHLLQLVQNIQGNLEKSLYYSLECVKSMESTKDTLNAQLYYHFVGENYSAIGNHEKSLEWYHKAIKIKSPEDRTLLYHIINIASKELLILNRKQEALDLILSVAPLDASSNQPTIEEAKGYVYDAVGNKKLAEKHFANMIALYQKDSENTPVPRHVSLAYLKIGTFYVEQEYYTKAKVLLLKSLEFPAGTSSVSNKVKANLMLFKTDSALGNYKSAIKYYQRYKELNDSIFNETKSRQIEELQIQYETVKKEHDIQSLKNENLIQNSKLAKTTILKNFVFGGLILFFIVSLLLYRSYNSKQRTNRLLVSQKGEIAQQNTSLQELLKEKEWLLKEIHHRVKNNLQIVMSLLNTQSNYIKNPEAFSAIKNSQHRLFAISLIHQKLYKTENATLIDMNSYIKDLIGYLKDSLDMNSNIDFKLEIEHIMLQENQSIPVGLILNEAITNAIKYAFPNQEKGMITVIMKKQINNYFISIKDNGVGIPDSFSWHTSSSLGMTLIKGLTNQLDGDFKIKNKEGTLIEIVFVNKTFSDIYTQNF
nr:histidine kinase dimerization/phosphoacceptor domain -containing protein [Mariniflexile sp. KMM 9835]